MKNRRFIGNIAQLAVIALILIPVFKYLVQPAFGAQLTRATIRFDRMQTSQPANVYVQFVPLTVGTTQVRIVFGAGVGIAGTEAVTVTGLGVSAIALPGALTAVGSGGSVTVSGLTTLTVGTTYGFNLSTGISTPSSTGSLSSTLQTLGAGGTLLDQTVITSYFITNDQLVITGNVPPTFSFTMSGNTDTFTGNLSTSVMSTNGQSVTVSTNAAKGWTGWVKSANAALTSANSGESIGTTGSVDGAPSTCQTSTDCYVLDVGVTAGTNGSGSINADPEYAGNGTTSGGTLSTSFQPFATRTGKISNDVVWLKAHASIIATKAAASDYTDTLTIIGAGNF